MRDSLIIEDEVTNNAPRNEALEISEEYTAPDIRHPQPSCDIVPTDSADEHDNNPQGSIAQQPHNNKCFHRAESGFTNGLNHSIIPATHHSKDVVKQQQHTSFRGSPDFYSSDDEQSESYNLVDPMDVDNNDSSMTMYGN